MDQSPGESPGERRQEQVAVAVALALTASTGVVDAVGYLGLGRVFTGNMTGNVVLLGMGLTGARGLPVLRPLVALAAFAVGATAGGRVLRGAGRGWTAHTSGLLAVVALGEAALSLQLLLHDPTAASGAGGAAGTAVTGALGAVMGVQAATARRLGVAELPTVVVTSTLTALAADSWLGARVAGPWPRRAAAVVLISTGAAVGALLLRWHPGAALALSTALTTAVLVAGHSVLRRPHAD